MKVIHFYNGLGGGIQNLISHLINFKINPEIEYEIVYVIEKKNLFRLQKISNKNFVKEHYLIYETDWNFYFTIRKLKGMIADEAVLITHDWLELGMVSQLKISNPVISFLHGNYVYYLELYQKHFRHVNLYLSVTKALINEIRSVFDNSENHVIQYSIPVCDFKFQINRFDNFRILFIANDLTDKNKNFQYLSKINQLIFQKEIKVEWHIVGLGRTEYEIVEMFNLHPSQIKYYGYVDNQKLEDVLSNANILISCSDNEGLPLSLVESMKAGLIPIVNKWNGAAYEIIDEGINGFVVSENKPEEFAAIIHRLDKNKGQLPHIAKNASEVAYKRHSFKNQINEFEEIVISQSTIRMNREPQKVYGSLLDNPFIPNFLTNALRKTLNKIPWSVS